MYSFTNCFSFVSIIKKPGTLELKRSFISSIYYTLPYNCSKKETVFFNTSF